MHRLPPSQRSNDKTAVSNARYKVFTTLDLVAGYYQIPIAESSRKFTGFVSNYGHYEFNRMPFGLVNAPSVFQEAMNKIGNQLKPGEAIPYLDDIIIPNVDLEQGLERLKQFLTILSRSGLALRNSKCKFLAEEITFLGSHRRIQETRTTIPWTIYSKEGARYGQIRHYGHRWNATQPKALFNHLYHRKDKTMELYIAGYGRRRLRYYRR